MNKFGLHTDSLNPTSWQALATEFYIMSWWCATPHHATNRLGLLSTYFPCIFPFSSFNNNNNTHWIEFGLLLPVIPLILRCHKLEMFIIKRISLLDTLDWENQVQKENPCEDILKNFDCQWTGISYPIKYIYWIVRTWPWVCGVSN